jgi:hypothetical protein
VADSPLRHKAREWAVNAFTWEPGRDFVKAGVRGGARVRGKALELTGRVPEISTIFLACSPKAGSQWTKALFDHPIVQAKTGLFTLPQRDYQALKPYKFPAGTLVVGLYCGYDHYLKIPKPLPYRTVYVYRDPRELAVSAYYSALKTHRIIGDLAPIREKLQNMSFDEGLLWYTGLLDFRYKEIATWAGVQDPMVLMLKLEDIGANPRENVKKILDHCEVHLTDAEFETVLADVDRGSLQKKDLEKRADQSESHYRVKRESFRDVFKPEHYALIEEMVPGLVEKLGYER